MSERYINHCLNMWFACSTSSSPSPWDLIKVCFSFLPLLFLQVFLNASLLCSPMLPIALSSWLYFIYLKAHLSTGALHQLVQIKPAHNSIALLDRVAVTEEEHQLQKGWTSVFLQPGQGCPSCRFFSLHPAIKQQRKKVPWLLCTSHSVSGGSGQFH